MAQQLGKYTIDKKVGKGGMGLVYKRTISDSGEEVAIKILPKKMAENPNFVQRFIREANVAHARYRMLISLMPRMPAKLAPIILLRWNMFLVAP